MNAEITDTERAALEVLRSTGVEVLEAALVAKEALECRRGRVRLGAEEMRKREKTVTFRKAVELALEEREKKNRRARTVTDFRYYSKQLMVRNPGLAERRVRSITSDDCRAYLLEAYGESPSQYRKARAILSGVFSTAIKHDWCDANPVARVEVPDVVEKPIEPLTIEEVERLEAAAQLPEHREMQLSLHLMLYCGIRPMEVSRIRSGTRHRLTEPARGGAAHHQQDGQRTRGAVAQGGCHHRPHHSSLLDPPLTRVTRSGRLEQGNRPSMAVGCLPPHVCHVSCGVFQEFCGATVRDGPQGFQPAAYAVRVCGERNRSLCPALFQCLIY